MGGTASKGCDFVGNRLPINERNRDNFKVGCKAVVGGPSAAFFHASPIGAEPKRFDCVDRVIRDMNRR